MFAIFGSFLENVPAFLDDFLCMMVVDVDDSDTPPEIQTFNAVNVYGE